MDVSTIRTSIRHISSVTKTTISTSRSAVVFSNSLDLKMDEVMKSSNHHSSTWHRSFDTRAWPSYPKAFDSDMSLVSSKGELVWIFHIEVHLGVLGFLEESLIVKLVLWLYLIFYLVLVRWHCDMFMATLWGYSEPLISVFIIKRLQTYIHSRWSQQNHLRDWLENLLKRSGLYLIPLV